MSRTDAPSKAPAEAPAAASADTGERDAFFDNAKFLAILLVAAGHAAEPLLAGSHTMKAAYLLVYSFHMPAFIVITGYFAKNFDAQPRRVRRLITGVAVPYVIFEIGYTVFENQLNDRNLELSLLNPWWLTWFLMCVFIWRLTAPIWRVIRWPFPVALAVSLLAPLQSLSDDLELNRLFQMLPFFVLGMVLKREHFALLHRRSVRIASVGVLAAGFAAAYLISDLKIREFFYWRSDRGWFEQFSIEQWMGMRIAMIACALIASAAFLSLVPRRRTWFTGLGAGTLYAFLLHGFIVKGVDYAGVYDLPELRSPFGMVSITLIIAGIAALLCTSPVRRAFKWVVEPELSWAFRPRRSHAAKGRPGAARDTERVPERERVGV